MYEDLKRNGQLCYNWVPASSQGPCHSMLLTGARTVVQSGSSKRLFLVLNWSKGKQFIEMSERYMDLCDTTVVFVRNVVIEPTCLGATTVAAPGHTHT